MLYIDVILGCFLCLIIVIILINKIVYILYVCMFWFNKNEIKCVFKVVKKFGEFWLFNNFEIFFFYRLLLLIKLLIIKKY